MNNVVLDRFPLEGVNEFRRQLEKDIEIKVEISIGAKIVPNKETENYGSLPLSKGIGIESCSWVIGKLELEFFSKYEGVFLSMLSRCDVYKNAFTTEEMAEHYYRLINFWIEKLKNKKINIIFSMDVPHVPSSFSLYLAAKYLKIPHIYLDCSLVYNKFHFLGCSFSNRMLLVEEKGRTSNQFISAHDKFFLDYETKSTKSTESTKSTSKYTDYFKTKKSRYWWNRLLMDLASSIPFSIRALLMGRFKFRGFYATELPWKISRRQWCDKRSNFLRISLFFVKIHERLKVMQSRRRYRKCCCDHTRLEKYILFAPPSEPEASVLPIALEMRRSYIALKMLIDRLPAGVKIAYKEHPVSFDQELLFVSEWKSDFYYESLAKLGKVEFVREDAPTRELLENAIGVATLNGSIALEALLEGKHCITFAPQWYDGLDGIHRVQSVNDVEVAIRLMINKKYPNPHPSQVNFSRNFVALDGLFNAHFSSDDFKQICSSMWNAYRDFLELDERKWEV